MSLSALKISELPDYNVGGAILNPQTAQVDFVVNVNNNTYKANLNSLQKLQKLELTESSTTALNANIAQITNLTAPTFNSTNATITNLTAPTLNSTNATITSLTGNVVGNIIGNVTGQATTANYLHTARNFQLQGAVTSSATSSNLASDLIINTQIATGAVNASQIANSAVNTDQLADNAVTSNKVASITGTKIIPNFGDQNITTTGSLTATNITTTSNVFANNLVASGNAFITNLVLGTQPNKATINYITNATRTFTIPNVAGSDFVMSAGDQIIGGNKTFTATIQGSINGNANTATTLETSRSIWGNSFNGSGPIGGVLELPNGTVSAPALTFANDLHTGIFRPGNNVLNIVTDSTTRIQFDNSGGVWEYQGSPVTYGADQNLSNTDLQAKILILDSSAGGDRTWTMPDKSTLDNWSGGAISNQMGFDFTIINESATRTVTLDVNTNVFRNQPAAFYTVQPLRSATFRLRNIGSGYVVYCLSRGI